MRNIGSDSRTLKCIKTLCILIFCFFFVLSDIAITFAKDDQKFYTNDDTEIDDLFDDSAREIKENPSEYVTRKKTFVVVNEYKKDNKTERKVYVNTPNLVQYGQNLVTKHFDDGWENRMYAPGSKMVKDIGTKNNNVMNMLGFNISSPEYLGEYPRIYMSLNGILPTKWYQKAWRSVKSVVGKSFVKAPKHKNYKTLDYFNHKYSDNSSESLIKFMQNYWIDYFVVPLGWDGYFADAADYKNYKVTKEEADAAKEWLEENKSSIADIEAKQAAISDWEDKYSTADYTKKNNKKYKKDVKKWKKKKRKNKGSSPDWEDYIPNKPANVTEEERALLAERDAKEALVAKRKIFEELWDKGKTANEKTTDDKDYHFSYAQCLLDTPDYEKCEKKIDNNTINMGVSELFVDSGIYKIGLEGGMTADSTLASNNDDYSPSSSNTSGFNERTSPPDKTGFYAPNSSQNPFGINPSSGGNCTWYAYGRFCEIAGQKIPFNSYPNAVGFYEAAPSSLTKSMVPQVGAIAVWGYGGKNGNPGHVAVVEQVDRNGNIVTSESAWGSSGYGYPFKRCKYSKGTGKEGSGYYMMPGSYFKGFIYNPAISGDPVIVDSLSNYGSSGNGAHVKSLNYKSKLSRSEAIRLISEIQRYTGPAYKEVMDNIVAKMIENAESQGKDIKKAPDKDIRVMPYDVTTLELQEDKVDVTITDPRVERYFARNFLGGFIVTGEFNITHQLLNPHQFYNSILITCGNITKLSVAMQQACNFKFLEDMGLSPATLWKTAPSTFIAVFLMCMLILNIVNYTFKFLSGRASIAQVLGRVIVFIIALGLALLITTKPDETWMKTRKIIDRSLNMGENAAMSMLDIDELYGDKSDSSVNYYMPYFNLWSTYNTGYGILDKQQRVDKKDPEVEEAKFPKINGKATTFWSVILADSFNSKGKNEYVIKNDKTNDNMVNYNAYRVVDHFMAPRLKAEDGTKSNNLIITNKANENFNNKLQNLEFSSILGGLLGIINVFFISLIKFLIFLWFWYLLWIFAYQILLSMAKRDGNLKNVLIKTFSPIVFLPLWGMYGGLIITSTLYTDGVPQLILNLFWFVCTFVLLNMWRRSYSTFPASLKSLAALPYVFTMAKSNINNMQMGIQAKRFGINKNEETGDYDYKDFITETGESKYTDDSHKKLMEEWDDQLLSKFKEYRASASQNLSQAEMMYAEKHLSKEIKAGVSSHKEYNKKIKKGKIKKED